MSQSVQLKVRLPIEIKAWLISQAAINRSSQSSEVVRALRERMQILSSATRLDMDEQSIDVVSHREDVFND